MGEKIPMMHWPNRALLRTVMAAALGGSLLGFDTAVIAGATFSLTSYFHLSPALLGVTVSAALWGTIAGAMTGGVLGRRFGGRTSLFFLASCYLVSAVGCALSTSLASLLIFRIIGGIGMGGSSVVAPVYIAEVAPPIWRGRLVGAFQINIIGGILLAYLSNFLVGLFPLGDSEWRWQMGVAAVPAALFLFALLGIPESARWLAGRGRLAEANDALRKLGSTGEDLHEVLQSIRQAPSSKAEKLFQRRHLRPIVLALALAAFNQLIGINAVLYYLNDIFAMAGFERTSQNGQAVVVGVVMLVATVVALTLIDRFGRRVLLLSGSIGLALCLSGIVIILKSQHYQSLLLVLVLGYIACFAFSQGAVIWVYLSEIFPAGVREQGQSLGSSTHWVMNALVSFLFPVIAAYSRTGPFVAFLVIVIFQFFAVLLFFPETKGITLDAIGRQIDGQGGMSGTEGNVGI
jgi:sugar porter (SP) family MFS transporter